MRVTLYHGTAHSFSAFSPGFAHMGAEPNSALGIHLTEDPADAAEYAKLAAGDRGAGTPRVLVVEADVGQVYAESSIDRFLGYGEDRSRVPREWFVAMREHLAREGYDALATDGNFGELSGIWVVFDPAKVAILGEMSLDEAWESDSATDYNGVRFESATSFPDFGGEASSPPVTPCCC